MNKQDTLKFAFAVNDQNSFQKKHFGDADKYIIHEWVNNEFVEISDEKNIFKDLDESHIHGSIKKGEAIINFLKQKDVNVLVSMQFGKNIKLVNQNFVPVIVNNDNLENTMLELIKHIKWIEDELKNKNSDYMLFSISKGALKRKVDNNTIEKLF